MNEVFAGLPRFPQFLFPIGSSSFAQPAHEEMDLPSNCSMMIEQDD